MSSYIASLNMSNNSATYLVDLWLNARDFNTAEIEHKFLRTFLKYTENRCFEYQHMKLLHADSEYADQRARNVYITDIDWRSGKVVRSSNLLKSRIREVHRIVSMSTRSHNHMSNEYVIEFMESLMENLKDLLILKVDLVDTLKVKLIALGENLRFLRSFLVFTGKRCTDHAKLNELFTIAKDAADNAAYLSYSCLVDEMEEEILCKLVSDLSVLVLKFDPANSEIRYIYTEVLKASFSESSQPYVYSLEGDEISAHFLGSLLEILVELLGFGLLVPMRNQILILLEKLSFLRGFLMDPPNRYTNTETLKNLLEQSIAISMRVGLLVYSLYADKMDEETKKQVHFSLVNLLKETTLIKVEITKIYHKVPKSPFFKFSSFDDLGWFDGFLGNLRELMNNMSDSVTMLNLPVKPLVEELHFLGSIRSKLAQKHPEHEKLQLLWTQIKYAAYKTEYIIDSLLVGNGPIWHHMLYMDEVRKEIESLKTEVNVHDNEVKHDCNAESFGQESLCVTTSPELDDQVIVGFEKEEENIVLNIAGGSKNLQMISIVGMPGIGKTQLAKKIYNNFIVKSHFDVRAWCYVSQEYNRKSVLSEILNQVAEPTKEMSEMTEEDLAAELYKSLKWKRYLILIDDLWDTGAWYALKPSFPDDKQRSRIMFTSRFHNLDLKSSSKIHCLSPLTDEKSWLLLQEKLFKRKSCPSELAQVGEKIAKNCNGLPLTITVVAGILSRIGANQEKWKEVMDSQSSFIVSDPEKQSMKAIELSYKHLPDYLKPCYLYMGAFFKNEYIPIRKLICLWIAEGFVQKVEHKSVENIAEDYVTDLISRSLLLIEKRRSTGDVKLCRVHDLIHEFCVEKSKENYFLQLIEGPPRLLMCEQRRISCYQPKSFLEAVGYSPHVRSLLFFSPSYNHTTRGYEVASLCEKFKLLRVLDLVCIMIQGKFPDCINLLSNLRYLAMYGEFNFIPSSIVKLRNLETLIVKGYTKLVHLPVTIWNMVKLRHLHIEVYAFLSQPSSSLVSQLHNLQKVSTLVLSYEDNSVKLMEGIANVRTLKCIFLESWDSSENCNWLPNLAILSQLESLSMSYHGEVRHPYRFSFPSTIKRLTMSEFRLPWEQISVIGKLPNLEVLKLCRNAVQGEEWEMRDGEFLKLKFLKLEELDIRKWRESSDGNFPPLEQLVLQGCKNLREIPSTCLEGSATLSLIKVIECRSSLEEVVREIQYEQMDLGNEELKVIIKSST